MGVALDSGSTGGGGEEQCLAGSGVPCAEFVDGLDDQGQGHVVDFEAVADVVEEGDGELEREGYEDAWGG